MKILDENYDYDLNYWCYMNFNWEKNVTPETDLRGGCSSPHKQSLAEYRHTNPTTAVTKLPAAAATACRCNRWKWRSAAAKKGSLLPEFSEHLFCALC